MSSDGNARLLVNTPRRLLVTRGTTPVTLIVVFLLALPAVASAATSVLQQRQQQQPSDPEPREIVSGLYSPHITDFTVVVPRKVDSEGRHISHSLVHHHNSAVHDQRRRRRRQAPSSAEQEQEPAYFALPVPLDDSNNTTEELVLELWPSTSFLAPKLVVQRPLRSTHQVPHRAGPAATCHFQGRVKGEPHSSVAISACHGLAGLVRSRRRGELWVEPAINVVNGAPDTDGGQLHIVYRRSAALNPTKRRKKKKRSHEKNCGTREPRRVVRLLKGGGRGRRKKGHQGKRRHDESYGRVRWRRAVYQGNIASEWLNDSTDESELAWWEHYHHTHNELPMQHDPGDGFSESIERHVEALVVADRSMLEFHHGHGGTDVETYLLTVMNMVSAFFRDPSIGNRINIIVVKMAFMDELSQGVDELNVTVNADATLESFCTWQMANNHPGDEHVNHHDVAILVTRVDICARSDEPCGTLGVAHVAGMCHPSRSCSVNQDNGLAVAHTIAHELGHNFGMVHDAGPLNAGCGSRDGSTLHVMTASFEADTDEVAWSPCSRRAITRFLDQGGGECLKDEPAPPEDLQYDVPQLPAGAMYDAEHQCRLQFNASASGVCSAPEEICSQLWCVVDGNCATLLRPPADGTHCGWHKWCMGRECVELREAPGPVHGGWGEWGAWSECSRSCGGGVASTERECDHPRPAHNGNYCLGRRKRYQVCNTQLCPDGAPSYRAVQCDNYVDTKNKDKDFGSKKWLPYFDKSSPCSLFCTDAEQSVVVEAAHAAFDGTPCNASARDMCIDGRCRRVGCDWRVESGAEEDACGVCRGDGSLCETVSREFLVREGSGYTEAAVIPEGARNIRVEEMSNSRTFIGIASKETDHFYVDGKRWRPQWAGECEVAGSSGTYERWGDRETLTVRGPINETLRLYVIFHGRYRNFGVHYEYTVQRRSGEAPPEFYWGFSEWSACSITCGIGVQVAQPVCLERLLGQVDDSRCQEAPPGRLLRACAMSPCPASWWMGPWQLCPVTCGGPKTMRHRSVLCVRAPAWDDPEDEDVQALPDSECEGHARPPETEPCPNISPCKPGEALVTAGPVTTRSITVHTTRPPPAPRVMRRHRKREEAWAREQALVLRGADTERFIWLTDNWGECPRRCGGSSRRRDVSCHLASSGHRVSGRHCPKPKPPDHEPCNLRPCEQWVTSRWSLCSASCGDSRQGYRARRVECPQPPHCDPSKRPAAAETCSPADCP